MSKTWRKSSYSDGGTSGNCVEVANLGTSIGVRDSKNPSCGHLAVPRRDLVALTDHIKSGKLDL
ncbi:DUF397 domain-containing protein [Actinomadura parmotrematis]|uniref:DUF397 domain-containing protein n=1 Tax=Actinomadura parmotrematis TaxID=2864039 RepID=A0ABS7FMH0_9ACTN|nr:DUF397 domain-containing protein [Actinomadura parmotrematis]MBW8481561.1 DUF397 domain-containing protein [Actinomadura parmotrematis]